jgi:hypothetical protein
MPDFPDNQTIKNYPLFESIEPYIREMIEAGVQHILLNEEESKFEYSKGIHLCVDNCRNNFVHENMVLRLIYPDKSKDKEIIKHSPAFIVIGGSTLSRGLTLEGLTTSYFIRTTMLADALMQMGRWFGFRRGYELLPRLWLSERVCNQFKFLTVLDSDLREELRNMESLGMSPKEYAPRLDSFPNFAMIKATSKQKMQKSIEIDRDFSNKKGQITKFINDDRIIENNYEKAVAYINSLGPVDRSRILSLENESAKGEKTYIWFNRPYEEVVDLLFSLNYPSQQTLLGNKEESMKWFRNQVSNKYLNNFTVLVSSNETGEP